MTDPRFLALRSGEPIHNFTNGLPSINPSSLCTQRKKGTKYCGTFLKQPGISYLNSLLWNVTFERDCTRLSFSMHSKLERDSACNLLYLTLSC